MKFPNRFPSKFYYLIFFSLFVIKFMSNVFASQLSEEWIELNGLYGEERRQTQSLISKRKHFNSLIDNQKYEDALKYSKTILENPYHTEEDETVFRDVRKGLQSISAMRQHFHSKVEEKEYAYARDYLADKILTHSYHDDSDKLLIKLVTKKFRKERKGKVKKPDQDKDISALVSLMEKNCYIRFVPQKERKEKRPSRRISSEPSGSNYLNYINDLMPDQR